MNRSVRALAAIAVTACVLLGVSFRQSWASTEPSCAPAITTTSQAIRQSDGAIVGLDVTMQASAPRPDGDRLTSITFTRAVNGGVKVDARVVSLPSTISLPSRQSWTFRL